MHYIRLLSAAFDLNSYLYGDGGFVLSSNLRYSSMGLRMSVTLNGVECRPATADAATAAADVAAAAAAAAWADCAVTTVASGVADDDEGVEAADGVLVSWCC